MAATYEPIASTTLGASAAAIEFTSIPGTYTDLVVVLQGATATAGTGTSQLYVRFNGDTGSNYSSTEVSGNGTTAGSSRGSNQNIMLNIAWPNAGNTTIRPGIAVLNVMSYANTNVYKTMLTAIMGGTFVSRDVSLWRSTSAITTVRLFFNSTNQHDSGTVASLYGIKAA